MDELFANVAVRVVPLTVMFNLSDSPSVVVWFCVGRSSPFTQDSTVERDALPLNRWPSSHVALLAWSWRFVALEPRPLLPEVQKDTMVLPLRS